MQLSPSPGSGGGVGGLRANYLLPCCCILDSLKFDMQRDHVLKKLTFEPPPPPPPRVGVGGGVVGCGSADKIFATMLLYS